MAHHNNALLEQAQLVGQRAQQLSERLLSPASVAGLDYISLYTVDRTDYEQKQLAALALGMKVGEKNGDIFQLPEAVTGDLPTVYVRVCQPPDGPQRQLGCADIIPVDYASVRQQLAAVGCAEMTKSLAGQEYGIVAAEASDLQVSLYVPSMRILALMGIVPLV